jgi:hypothetical protein
LQSITAITEDKAIEYMTAAGLSIASVTKAAASAMPHKGSKPVPIDLEKVSLGFCHSDNIAIRDLDSESLTKHIALAIDLEVVGGPATVEQQYQFLVTDATCYALLVLGFRIGLKAKEPRHMEFLLGHMASARMVGKTLLLNWDVHIDVKQGVTMDKLLDRVLAFKKDPDGNIRLTHYPYVLLGRRASDGRQRLPILGSYAELAEVYKRAFQLLAVLHGDRMFGEIQQALFWLG